MYIDCHVIFCPISEEKQQHAQHGISVSHKRQSRISPYRHRRHYSEGGVSRNQKIPHNLQLLYADNFISLATLPLTHLKQTYYLIIL